MTDISPLTTLRETVRPEWVDYNGHMNLAYFVLVFDHATDGLLDHVGMDETYRARTGRSVFVLEAHENYLGEVFEGEPLRVTTQVLNLDEKRLHLFHQMYKGETDDVAATSELMILHVDLMRRGAVPFGAAEYEALRDLARAHTALSRPERAGRSIGIPLK